MQPRLFPLVLCAIVGAPSVASAHIHMVAPSARGIEQKQGPCGPRGSKRGDVVTTVLAGSVLRLEWTQMYDHPGHYRVSFDADGDDGFVDPIDIDARNSNEAVLLDGYEPQGAGPFTLDVQLPDIECNNCTLQLIQVMYDHGEYAPGTDDIYYQCADLVLTRDADAATPPPPELDSDGGTAPGGTPGTTPGGGGSSGSGSTPGTETDTSGAQAGGGSSAPSSQPGSYSGSSPSNSQSSGASYGCSTQRGAPGSGGALLALLAALGLFTRRKRA